MKESFAIENWNKYFSLLNSKIGRETVIFLKLNANVRISTDNILSKSKYFDSRDIDEWHIYVCVCTIHGYKLINVRNEDGTYS